MEQKKKNCGVAFFVFVCVVDLSGPLKNLELKILLRTKHVGSNTAITSHCVLGVFMSGNERGSRSPSDGQTKRMTEAAAELWAVVVMVATVVVVVVLMVGGNNGSGRDVGDYRLCFRVTAGSTHFLHFLPTSKFFLRRLLAGEWCVMAVTRADVRCKLAVEKMDQ